MKRCITRSFFFLLLLCIGGWAWSYRSFCNLSHNDWHIVSIRGKICLLHVDPHFWALADESDLLAKFGNRNWLGFGLAGNPDEDETLISIPFWFPTLLVAVSLSIVWRFTRTKKSNAFPLQPAKPTPNPPIKTE